MTRIEYYSYILIESRVKKEEKKQTKIDKMTDEKGIPLFY